MRLEYHPFTLVSNFFFFGISINLKGIFVIYYMPASIWSLCLAFLLGVHEMQRPSDFCPVAFKNIFQYALLISSVSQLHFAWWLNTNACLLIAKSCKALSVLCTLLYNKKTIKEYWKIALWTQAASCRGFLVYPIKRVFLVPFKCFAQISSLNRGNSFRY